MRNVPQKCLKNTALGLVSAAFILGYVSNSQASDATAPTSNSTATETSTVAPTGDAIAPTPGYLSPLNPLTPQNKYLEDFTPPVQVLYSVDPAPSIPQPTSTIKPIAFQNNYLGNFTPPIQAEPKTTPPVPDYQPRIERATLVGSGSAQAQARLAHSAGTSSGGRDNFSAGARFTLPDF